MDRLLKSQPGTLTFTVEDEDGVAAVPTGAVTIQIRDSAGTALLSPAGTATDETGGVFTYIVGDAITANLGSYSVEWTFTLDTVARTVTTFLEIVGGFLFTISAFRLRYPQVDAATYTGAMVRAARVAAEERFETLARVAFVPRAKIATLSGDGTTTIILPDGEIRSISSASIDGTALTSTELAALAINPAGIIKRTDSQYWTEGRENIVIAYECGFDFAPEPVSRSTMILAYDALIPSALSPRAMSQSTDLGEIRFSMANVDLNRPTGIPEVDATIQTFGRSRPAVG